MRLILASASPRRAALLRDAGYAFVVEPADVDEQAPLAAAPLPGELALSLARAKADVVARRFPDDVTLAADTVVAVGDVPLGKPADAADARAMIRRLANAKTHQVITGVVVRCPGRGTELAATAVSTVRVYPLNDGELDRYVATGLWRGKAGGYGIQDPDPIVACEAGSVTNVIGLPIELATEFLGTAGVAPKSGGLAH